jgi:hypothetical protein
VRERSSGCRSAITVTRTAMSGHRHRATISRRTAQTVRRLGSTGARRGARRARMDAPPQAASRSRSGTRARAHRAPRGPW